MHYLEQLFNAFFRHAHPVGPGFIAEHLISEEQKRKEVCRLSYTAISRKVVGKNVHSTIPKGNMGYVQYTVPDTVAVEPTFVAFL